MQPTNIRFSLKPGEFRPGVKFAMDQKVTLDTLGAIGISAEPEALRVLMQVNGPSAAMDAAPDMITTASALAPVQFLQHWLNEQIIAATVKRDIDELVGRDTGGSFADAEVVQTVVELTGKPRGYADRAQSALADFNVNYEARTIIRHELDLEVGKLEEEQASKSRLSAASLKREAVQIGLEIERNLIGFYGFSEGLNKTYGITNDPNLSAYETVPASGTGNSTKWQDKNFLQIQGDFLLGMQNLRNKSGQNVDPNKDRIDVWLSANAVQWLDKTNELGTKSVREWIKETFPGVEIKPSAWLDGVNGDQNVFYLTAEKINGKPVVRQLVQDIMRLMGVFPMGKKYQEQFANATAGVFVVQPIGIVRYTGI